MCSLYTDWMQIVYLCHTAFVCQTTMTTSSLHLLVIMWKIVNLDVTSSVWNVHSWLPIVQTMSILTMALIQVTLPLVSPWKDPALSPFLQFSSHAMLARRCPLKKVMQKITSSSPAKTIANVQGHARRGVSVGGSLRHKYIGKTIATGICSHSELSI